MSSLTRLILVGLLALAGSSLIGCSKPDQRWPWPTAKDGGKEAQTGSIEVLSGIWVSDCIEREDGTSVRFDIDLANDGQFTMTEYRYIKPQCLWVVRDTRVLSGQAKALEKYSDGITQKLSIQMDGPFVEGDLISAEVLVTQTEAGLVIRPIETEVYFLGDRLVKLWEGDNTLSKPWNLHRNSFMF